MTENKNSFYPGYSFGLRKELVKKYATEDEVKRAVALIDKMREHRYKLARAWEQRVDSPTAETLDYQRKHRKLEYVASAEMRGLRKLWRCRHTDSYSAGLYYLAATIRPWQVSIPIGDCGTHNWGSIPKPLPPKTLLVWVGRDELHANEFMVSNTNFLIKVPRGQTTSDKILRVKEQ